MQSRTVEKTKQSKVNFLSDNNISLQSFGHKFSFENESRVEPFEQSHEKLYNVHEREIYIDIL